MLRIEVLTREHHRKAFDCGVTTLNAYLSQTAVQHAKKGLSKTFVAVEESHPFNIVGFFTLTLSEIDQALLPDSFAKKLPNHNLPVIKLARLAIAKEHQGQGIGEALLFESLSRAYQVYELVGAIALFVDAKDDRAASFYQRYGFVPIPSFPLQLFLAFDTIGNIVDNES